MNDKPYDVFLSYSSTDRGFVRAVAERLHKEAKLRVWFDEWSIPPGDPWQEALEAGLEESASVVVFLGTQGIRPWQNEEMRSALETRAADPTFRVVPAILPGAQQPFRESSLPRFLRRLIWVEFASEADENAFWRIQCGIAGRPPGRSRSEAEGTVLHKLPYRGLEVFREEDRDLFFGREAVVERLLRYFEEHRFLAVFGPSGSGKSSVVQAGLVPHLREAEELITLFTPGERPLEELAFSLHRLSPQLTTEGLLERLEGGGLHFVVRELIEAEKAHGLVVVIDQFEELFTLCKGPDRRKEFQDILLRAVDRPNPAISLILTLRSDFLGRFATHPDFNIFVTDHLVQLESMGAEELRSAIVNPAQVVGLEFEDGLVDQVLRDAQAGSEVLPLLEHALLEVVKRRNGRYLSLAAYRELGGIEGALIAQAEAEFAALTDRQRDTLRKIFVLCLIHPGEGSEDTRRRARRDELHLVGHDEVSTEALLSQWTHARLLTTRRERGVDWVEVSHEALIRRWKRIGLWMEDGRERARLVSRLRQASSDWRREGKSPDYLFQGARLAQVEEVLKQHDEIPSQEYAFIRASIAHRDKLRLDTSRQNRLAFLALVAILIVVSFLAVRWRLSENLARQQLIKNYWKLSQDFRSDGLLLESLHSAAEAISLGPEPDIKKAILTDVEKSRPRWALRLKLLTSPLERVVGATFNAAGTRILTWNEYGVARLWDGTGRIPVRFTLKEVGVSGATFNTAGTQILTWSEYGTAQLWHSVTGDPIGTPLKHGGSVHGALFNAAETRILTWGRSGIARLWDKATGDLIGTPLMDERGISGAIFNTSGTRILTWNDDGLARLWDSATSDPIGTPMRHERTVSGATFNAAGTRILTWNDDGAARLWDGATGDPIGTPLQHAVGVHGATFNTAGTRILTWSEDGKARLWDGATGDPIGTPLNHAFAVHGATFNVAETRILTWGRGGTARLWNGANGEPVATLKHERSLSGAVFNADGTQILTWSEDGTVHLWSGSSGEPIGAPLKHLGSVTEAKFNADGTRILTWGENGPARLWLGATGEPTGTPLKHEMGVSRAMFNTSGTQVLTWSEDGTARLWKGATGDPIGTPLKHKGRISGATFNAAGTRIFTWSEDGTSWLWDAATGEPIGTPLKHERGVSGATLSVDGTRILTWDPYGTAQLWDGSSGKNIGTPLKHERGVSGATLSPDGTRMLTWGRYIPTRLWNGADGESIGAPFKHKGRVSGATFNPAGTRILTWSADGVARLWDGATGESMGISLKPRMGVSWALFNEAGTRILTWERGGTGQLWDGSSGESIGTPLRPEGRISGATLSVDGTRMLAWNNEGLAWLWNGATGKPIGTPLKHEGGISDARFNIDATRIFTRSIDGTSWQWNGSSGEPIGTPWGHSWTAFNVDGTRILTCCHDDAAWLWDIEADFDVPSDLFKLQVEVLSGTEFVTARQEVRLIEPMRWNKLAEEYDAAASSHYLVCKYPERNLWRWFNPEEAEKIRPLVPR